MVSHTMYEPPLTSRAPTGRQVPALQSSGGPKVAQLQNERGVILQVHGVQIGLEVNLDLAGMTLSFN